MIRICTFLIACLPVLLTGCDFSIGANDQEGCEGRPIVANADVLPDTVRLVLGGDFFVLDIEDPTPVFIHTEGKALSYETDSGNLAVGDLFVGGTTGSILRVVPRGVGMTFGRILATDDCDHIEEFLFPIQVADSTIAAID